MLNSAVTILASLKENESINFYNEELAFTFHNLGRVTLLLVSIRHLSTYDDARLIDQQLVPSTMHIDDLYIGVILQVLANLTQEDIHAPAIKVVIIMPNVE